MSLIFLANNMIDEMPMLLPITKQIIIFLTSAVSKSISLLITFGADIAFGLASIFLKVVEAPQRH